MMDEWQIEFYIEEDSGRVPVMEFMETLDQRTREELFASIELLRVRNIHAREPLVRKIEGKIWELREEVNTNIYRIFYFFFTGRRIILLHGFMKKTQKLPRRELAVAQSRLDRFVSREEKR